MRRAETSIATRRERYHRLASSRKVPFGRGTCFVTGRHRGEILILLSASALCGAFVSAQTPPQLCGCPVFPADNIWNTRIDSLPLDGNSAAYIQTNGATSGLHPDFGAGLWDGGPIGIPYTVVTSAQPKVAVSFDYEDESDPGPYPIPADVAIEGGAQSGGDRHVLVLDRDNCVLYEMFSSYPQPDGSWEAGSGAVFDLRSHALRPAGWTSADAAGLPILPGLVRYDEVAAGEIKHALRFTAPGTRRQYVWPARHYASSLTETRYPPMGQRFRLRSSFNLSGFSSQTQVILRALQRYGMILADNGSAWFISGVPDERWDNDSLVSELRLVKGSDFEAVDASALMLQPDSGQVKSQAPPQKCDLRISVEATPDPAIFRARLVYRISVSNQGPGQATRVTLREVYSDKSSVAQVSCGQCSYSQSANEILMNLGTLAASASRTVSVTTRPRAPHVRFITNFAAVSADEEDSNPADNEVTTATRVVIPDRRVR